MPETLQGKQLYTLDLGALVAGSPLPRRLRGAPEEGAEGDPHPRRHHPVHRRAAHARRCRCGRGRDRRRRRSSSRCSPAVSSRPSVPPRSTSTASTSRRTPRSSGASSRSRSRSRRVAHTIEILKGLRDRYEAHHRVTITDQAIVAAANLADRYISDRHLPDKAIDLIDEAGSRLRIRRMQAPPDYRELEDEIANVRKREGSGDRGAAVRAGREAARPTRRSCSSSAPPRRHEWQRRGRRPLQRGQRGVDRRGARAVDRHPRLQAHRGGDRQAAPHGGGAAQADRRPGRRRSRRCRRRSAAPVPASRTRSARRARSSSSARPASGRPRPPRRSPSSSSVTRPR